MNEVCELQAEDDGAVAGIALFIALEEDDTNDPNDDDKRPLLTGC